MRTPKSELSDGEILLRESGGGPASFLGAKGGHMYLTNKRIFHETLMGKKVSFQVNIDDIVGCDKVLWSNIACVIPLMKCLKINIKNGSAVKLKVVDMDGWTLDIKKQINYN